MIGLILLLEIHLIKLNGSRKENKNAIPWKPEEFKVDPIRENCVFINGHVELNGINQQNIFRNLRVLSFLTPY